jgi:hypothetical protein
MKTKKEVIQYFELFLTKLMQRQYSDDDIIEYYDSLYDLKDIEDKELSEVEKLRTILRNNGIDS